MHILLSRDPTRGIQLLTQLVHDSAQSGVIQLQSGVTQRWRMIVTLIVTLATLG